MVKRNSYAVDSASHFIALCINQWCWLREVSSLNNHLANFGVNSQGEFRVKNQIGECSNNCIEGLSITPHEDGKTLSVGVRFNNSLCFKQALQLAYVLLHPITIPA